MVFIKTDMVAKGIPQDDIPENWVGRWVNKSLRMRTVTVVLENDYFLIHGLGKCE